MHAAAAAQKHGTTSSTEYPSRPRWTARSRRRSQLGGRATGSHEIQDRKREDRVAFFPTVNSPFLRCFMMIDPSDERMRQPTLSAPRSLARRGPSGQRAGRMEHDYHV